MENQEKDQVIASLIEANDILQLEVTRLRDTARILRRVHSALRATITSQQRQLEIATFNDNAFKELCEFGATGTQTAEGGLPEASSVVESAA